MRHSKWICIGLMLLLAGCSTQRALTPRGWRTMQVHGATLVVDMNGSQADIPCTVYATRDSALVVSATPFLGLEMLRLEFTPSTVMAANKISHQYVQSDWKTLSQELSFRLTWRKVQSWLTDPNWVNQLPPLTFLFQGQRTTCTLTYDKVVWNQPWSIKPLPLQRYEQIEWSSMLKK